MTQLFLCVSCVEQLQADKFDPKNNVFQVKQSRKFLKSKKTTQLTPPYPNVAEHGLRNASAEVERRIPRRPHAR